MTQYRYTTVNNPWSIGFEHVFRQLEEVHSAMANDNYPPHNIVKIDDDHFVVELAVAGFGETELDISVQNGVLTVTGSKEDTRAYVHKGISTRKFTRSWTLNEHVDVKGAALDNGILTIQLERNVPEAERPRKVKIGEKKAESSKKTFLSE
jgi:molecular chaperone IbpA